MTEDLKRKRDYSPEDCTTLEAYWFNNGYYAAEAKILGLLRMGWMQYVNNGGDGAIVCYPQIAKDLESKLKELDAANGSKLNIDSQGAEVSAEIKLKESE